MIPLSDLKSHLTTGELNPTYLFTGPEIAVMDIYIALIAKSAKADVIKVDTVAEAVKNFRNRKMVVGAPRIYVVRNDKDYIKAENFWHKIITGELQKKDRLIIIYSTLDKRTKFYKAHNPIMVEFDYLSPQVLIKYIQKDLKLEADSAEYLATLCGCDYSRIQLEMDKINALSQRRVIGHEEAFTALLSDGAIYVPPKDAIFDLTDALCKADIFESFYALDECIKIGEHPLAIISVLYNNIRSMYIVEIDGGGSGVAQRTGLTGFQVKLAIDKLNFWTAKDLLQIMREIQATEEAIKMGQQEPEPALVSLILKILYLGGKPF